MHANKMLTLSDVPGFKAVGIAAGLKKSGKKDLALILSEVPAVAAATFTTNIVKAAPLVLDAQHIQNPTTRAVLINSGNANACTGKKGMEDALTMAQTTAEALGIAPEEVLVSSTGIIGLPLPMEDLTKGIGAICEAIDQADGASAAEAIMTTDTFPKTYGLTLEIEGKTVTIAGIAKGSGMIHPNMGTMLAYVCTDAVIEKEVLQNLQRSSVEETYNMISVDGDTSTNDTAVVMANGLAGHATLKPGTEAYDQFAAAFHQVNTELAKLIAQDGEGATKLITVKVKRARSLADGRMLAKSVITSSLVKTAFFGNDANWGRILCALGYSGGQFVPDQIDLSFESAVGCVWLMKDGEPQAVDEELATAILSEAFVTVHIDLKDGEIDATAWGCDLSYDYVKINGDYRT